ncbi:hypothetical protein SLEP1_g22143 [Rubroshorea leprosula]|uniref:ELYS-like domain-containing protein n=1 Tax=Rubroshorea leprosula TaxID=152421 RepID=A0AAV5JH40_9ROSI|nr:hypothetical protein SLEP1_g22143 [Rubroshorea leprosula]
MENNLVSLICHYVTDVCMDETAVSSDAVTAWLLDEKVVKDWVKQTFKNIIAELQRIYDLEVEGTKNRLSSLLKFSAQLAGISNVLDVLESSFKDSLSAQLHDLHRLHESILKTKQHLEIATWCIRHQFLENQRCRHTDFACWRLHVRERKSAAIRRAWPDVLNSSADSGPDGSLFIEDALANLEIEQGYEEGSVYVFLQKNGALSFSRSKIEGMTGCYPFENLKAAVDLLFLCGSSDLVVAKQAIFLYYLFDWNWRTPDERWRDIVNDFSVTFGITRHSLLESFTFFLLDDLSDEALQEAYQILPEISGPSTHPKVAHVLLERGNPEAALMVLRWSGRDGVSQLVLLSEAVTCVRVKVECGLLTEAFTYQRMLCTKIRENKFAFRQSGDPSADLKVESRSWSEWVETLVTEICCLCIRRNLLDRMIELPWNFDEEKYIHKCLLDYATVDPSTTAGSLLVVFYLQRYRYQEAYQVNLKLWNMEEEFISKEEINEEVLSRMQSQRQRRKELVERGVELLPEVQQQQLKTGKLAEFLDTSGREADIPVNSDHPESFVSKATSLLVPSTSDSIVLQSDHIATPMRTSVFENSNVLVDSVSNSHIGTDDFRSSSVLQGSLFLDAERATKLEFGASRSFKFGNISTPGICGSSSPFSMPLKGTTMSSSKGLQNRHPQEKQSLQITSEEEQNGFINQVRNTSPPYSRRVTANPVSTLSSNSGFFKDSALNLRSNISGKRGQSDIGHGQWHMLSADEPMDVSGSDGEKSFTLGCRTANGELRWRSDEGSDEEEGQSPERTIEVDRTPMRRGIRRSRFGKG